MYWNCVCGITERERDNASKSGSELVLRQSGVRMFKCNISEKRVAHCLKESRSSRNQCMFQKHM